MPSASTSRNGESDGDRGARPRGANRADVRVLARGRLRRMDQRRGDAALVPLRPRLGHPGGRGRSPSEGGKIRVVMRRPDGTEVAAQGEYTVIDRPHRLVMTWTLDADLSNERLRRVRRIAITFATTRYASTASGRRSEPGCSRSTRRNAYAGQGALGAARADARAKHSAGASGGPAD